MSVICLKNVCLFCVDEANEEDEKKKGQNVRREIYHVSTFALKDSNLKELQTRSDDGAKPVIARIKYEYELFSAEAKYQNNCFNSF